jgi:tetratricopeptide (TPR) repeat protein
MQHTGKIYWFWILLLSLGSIGAQEEGTAELFTEEYTDRFQDVFFEAIKQKGIENYDRAEALFLEAKQLDPISPVIDHELARVLLLEKEYARAERYALDAVRARPGEYWFVHTLMEILDTQSKHPEAYPGELPLEMPEFRMNLATWYLGQQQWDRAQDQLAPLPTSKRVRLMKARISRSRLNEESSEAVAIEGQTPAVEEGSVAAYEQQLRDLLEDENWRSVEDLSREALESYPLQPFFYYANGVSQLRLGRVPEAIIALEEGEGVLLGDSETARMLYRALAEAHTQAGNTEKANKYLNKLKSGS